MPSQFFISTTEDDAEANQDGYYDEDDDGLGYYSDGVKRTLTDSQLSIFRHSEIQRILWREAGEYTGPIFPKVTKLSSLKKNKSKKPSDTNRKTAKDEAVKSNANDGALAEGGTASTKESESKRKASASPFVPGSNYTAPTASKKKRKLNKRKNHRSSVQSLKSKTEHIQAGLRHRRNSSSPELDDQPSKKAKTSGSPRSGMEHAGMLADVRNDPDDFKEEGEDFTYRRLARDEDDAPNMAIDLDY